MISLILAKILGLYFLALGLSFVINPHLYKKFYQQIVDDKNFIFLGALFALLIGAVIVSIHNHWIVGWPVIITILGWWSLIKGFALLSFPNFINWFSFIQNQSTTFYRLLGLAYAGLGVFFLYKGWF